MTRWWTHLPRCCNRHGTRPEIRADAAHMPIGFGLDAKEAEAVADMPFEIARAMQGPIVAPAWQQEGIEYFGEGRDFFRRVHGPAAQERMAM